MYYQVGLQYSFLQSKKHFPKQPHPGLEDTKLQGLLPNGGTEE